MSASRSDAVYLIDASIYIFKYYFSLPDNWWSKQNCPTAAVYGYTHWLFRFLKNLKPARVAVCFDESLENCFRNEVYADYKCSRALPDEELAFQIAACKLITRYLGIPVYASEKYEADDLIGTLAEKARKAGHREICILSRDKDLGQLLKNAQDHLWDYPDGEKLKSEQIQKKFGVPPALLADYLALVGDPGDDIPGVPGVGPKTASALLLALGGWKSMRKNLDSVSALPIRGAKTLGAKLMENRRQIDMALKLSTIVCKAPLGSRFNLRRVPFDAGAIALFGEEMGFGSRFATSVKKLQNSLSVK